MRATLRRLGSSPPARPDWSGHDVHLWLVDLDTPPEDRAVLWDRLTPDERERAGRYRMDRIREQFVAGRGTLRGLLGAYLDLPPHNVTIAYEPDGKPFLTPARCEGLQFNLSHSEGVAVIALAQGRLVGVDLERVRPVANIDGLVGRFFAPGEREAFQALPDDERMPAFFHGWTRKEALLKARGRSVQQFEKFEVSLMPGGARLLAWNDEPDAPNQWAVWSGQVGDYVTALAVEGEPGLQVSDEVSGIT